jgi:outer membrane protein TolC
MLALVFALVVAAPVCGPLDLPTVLSLVAERSDEVSIRQAEVLGAQADVAIANAAGILPGSTATILTGPAPAAVGTVVDAPGYSNRAPFRNIAPFGRIDITAIQPLWTWGQWSSAKEAAQAGARARGFMVKDTLYKVQARAVQLYWSIVLAERLLSIAKDVEDALADVEAKIDASLKESKGDVVQADRYRVQVFKADLLGRKAEAKKGLRLARVALAGTLAIDEPELALKGELLPGELDERPTQAEVLELAERQRPDLLALDQVLRAREAEVLADEAARLPTFFIGGTFAYSYAPNRTIQTNPWVSDFFNTLTAGVGLGLRQNLAFPLLQAQVDKARAELNALRREREGLLRLVRVDVESSVTELTATHERLLAARSAVKAGKAWFHSTGMTFGLGVSDAKGLVEAYTGYIQTQVNEAQAKFDVLVAKAKVDVLVGRPLAEGGTVCELR